MMWWMLTVFLYLEFMVSTFWQYRRLVNPSFKAQSRRQISFLISKLSRAVWSRGIFKWGRRDRTGNKVINQLRERHVSIYFSRLRIKDLSKMEYMAFFGKNKTNLSSTQRTWYLIHHYFFGCDYSIWWRNDGGLIDQSDTSIASSDWENCVYEGKNVSRLLYNKNRAPPCPSFPASLNNNI